MYQYNVSVIKVVDGDTIDVDIDLGFGMTYRKQRVRLMGCLLYTSPSPRDVEESRMPSSA